MSTAIFRQFAAYNGWANARIYAAALDLSEADWRRPAGVFFGSLMATLNHLLLTDRAWLTRLTGEGENPTQYDTLLHEDRDTLARARLDEDARIVRIMAGYDEEALIRPLAYRNMSGRPFEQPLWQVLLHFFNHQTHHRGQAHSCLSILTGAEPPSLDMVQFQRGTPAPDLAALIC